MDGIVGKVCGVLAAVLVGCSIASAAPPSDAWSNDVDVAWAKAKESGRPLVLFITTDGCMFCDKMLKETFKNDAVSKELADGFVPVVVHTRKNLELIRKLGVSAFPTTVVIGKDAKVLAAMPGYRNAVQMRDSLRVVRGDGTMQR